MQAFELTDDMKEQGFSGGTVHYGGGAMFNVGQALQEGDGMIVTNNDLFAEVLRQYPALQPVSADQIPKDAVPVKLEEDTAEMTTHSLLATTPPPTYQTNDLPGQVQVDVVTEPEIAAQHADEPSTPEEAIKAGEAVSGQPSGQSATDSSKSQDATNKQDQPQGKQ